MRQSGRNNRCYYHIHCDCCDLKKKNQTSHVWDVLAKQWTLFGLHSETMGTILLVFVRAVCRYLENDTNIHIWLKKNSNDNDVRTVFTFLDM